MDIALAVTDYIKGRRVQWLRRTTKKAEIRPLKQFRNGNRKGRGDRGANYGRSVQT